MMSEASHAWTATALTWRMEVLLLAAQAAANYVNSNGLAGKLPGTRVFSENYNRQLALFSGLFDQGYYLSNNPDVASSGHDPLDHFLSYGGTEGRSPSEFFSARLYLDSYEDVVAAKMNPLLHFIRFGAAEGRRIGAPDVFPSPPEPKNTFAGKSVKWLRGLPIHGASAAISSLLADLNHSIARVESQSKIDREQLEHNLYIANVDLEASLATSRDERQERNETDDLERKLYLSNTDLQRLSTEKDLVKRREEEEREGFVGRIEALQQARDELERRLYLANSDLQRISTKNESLQAQAADLERERHELERMVQEASRKFDGERERAARLEVESRDNVIELTKFRTKSEFETVELERLRVEERRSAQMKAELDEARIEIVKLKYEVERERLSGGGSNLLVDELREARSSLETQLQALADRSSDRQQIDAVLAAIAASKKTEPQTPDLDRLRDAIIPVLRWPIDMPAPTNGFDAVLFQNFVHKLLLATRVSEDGNLDKAYAAFSYVLDEERALVERVKFVLFVIANWPRLSAVYNSLEDDGSKMLFMQLLMFRSLGHKHVKLSSNGPDYWEMKKWSNDLQERPSSFTSVAGGENLKLFRISVEGREIELECLHANIFFTFGVNQYYYSRNGVSIAPAKGDHVIDAGTCFGDTAVRMALSVGEGGVVYSFDPVHVHQTIATSNVRRNKLNNVRFIPCGLSDTERNADASDSGVNPGFNVGLESDVPLNTIDNFVESKIIERVDFIKMDIEGSELSALRGAESSLKAFKPKLAISIYHKWEDYFSIAEYISSLDLGYRFFMENYTICEGETVLYCLAGD